MKLKELFESTDQFLKSREEIEAWLQKMGIEKYTINNDLSVDVNATVNIASESLEFLAVQFNKVNGHFFIFDNKLTSLKGCPKEVPGHFRCDQNLLKSLEGAPREVGGSFYCQYNNIVSLKGAPREVGGDFNCSRNKLTSLEGSPREVGADFICSSNMLTSLKGAPKEIGGDFDCYGNKPTDFNHLSVKLTSNVGGNINPPF